MRKGAGWVGRKEDDGAGVQGGGEEEGQSNTEEEEGQWLVSSAISGFWKGAKAPLACAQTHPQESQASSLHRTNGTLGNLSAHDDV